MSAVVVQLIGLVLCVSAAPLAYGLASAVKSAMSVGSGVSPFQPYRELLKLTRKEVVLADHASPFLNLAPSLSCGLIATAAVLVPTLSLDLVAREAGDLILILGLLGASRLVESLAALESGAGSAMLGASRRLSFFLLAEPAAMMIVLIWSTLAQSTVVTDISAYVAANGSGMGMSIFVGVFALIAVASADSVRNSVGESTSMNQASPTRGSVTPEYSGRALALIQFAGMMRFWTYLALAIALFAPWGVANAETNQIGLLVAFGWFLVKLVLLACVVAIIEALIARAKVGVILTVLATSVALGVATSLVIISPTHG